MQPEIAVIFAVLMGFVLLEIVFTSFFKKPGQNRGDAIVEIVSTGVLSAFTQPFVLAGGAVVAAFLAPDAAGILKDWPFLAVFALFLVFDDMTQYWWHRLSHSVPALYKLHRPHRNNSFYYLLMPGLWLSGALIFMGGGWVYAVYIVIKMSVIYGAHSDVRWDAPLYKISWLSPVMWVVERTISPPATHSAHHGKHAADGITNYKGNFGNLLFFWDVLFGTAKITRQYPEEIGVENLPDTSIAEQLLWPIISTTPSPVPVASTPAVEN